MPLIQTFAPSPNSRIGIWHITEGEDELRDAYQHLYVPDQYMGELLKVNVMRNAGRRLEYLASRLLMAEVLREMGQKYQGMVRNVAGQPQLISLPFCISISHSKGYAAVLVGPKAAQCGIDLELPREQLRLAGDYVFNEEEWAWADKDLWKLASLWACKEAVYKYMGRAGLSARNHLALQPWQEGPLNGVPAVWNVDVACADSGGENLKLAVHVQRHPQFMLAWLSPADKCKVVCDC
jgi:4'-phosphopantetheinyl transferase